jgi:hypothetical protein
MDAAKYLGSLISLRPTYTHSRKENISYGPRVYRMSRV